VEDFRVTSIDKKKAHVELLIPVDNQNRFGFKITDVSIDVKANGLYLGKITNTEGIKFKADTRSIYRFPLEVQFDLNVLLNPKLYATLLSNQAELQLNGYIKVRAFLVFSTKIDIDQTEEVKIINL
jgi:LEA14-like dessication related protein